MQGKSLAAGLSAGLIAFVVVAVLVTTVAERWIEFSLFVGIPAGLLAGLSVGAILTHQLTRRRSNSDQLRIGREQAGPDHLLVVAGWFVSGFTLTVVGLAAATDRGLTLAIVSGIVVGLVGSALGYRTGWPVGS